MMEPAHATRKKDQKRPTSFIPADRSAHSDETLNDTDSLVESDELTTDESEEGWRKNYRELDPSDSASGPHIRYSGDHRHIVRRPIRQHSIQPLRAPTRYYGPRPSAPRPPVSSQDMSTTDADLYNDDEFSPPRPTPRVAARSSQYAASRLTQSVAPPYSASSVYAPPYGQMVPYASQPYPFQGHNGYYQGRYFPPDRHYYPQLPIEISPHLSKPAPVNKKRPDEDPDVLRMEAHLKRLQLNNKKAELEDSIRQEVELRDKRDAERRTHEQAAMGAKPDQGGIGKILKEFKEVKSQLAQIRKSALNPSKTSPESQETSHRPSMKQRTDSQDRGARSDREFEGGLHEVGQDLEKLKKRFLTPRGTKENLILKAPNKASHKRRRVDFTLTVPPRLQTWKQSRTAVKTLHDQTRPAIRTRTLATMSGALPVEHNSKTRNAPDVPSLHIRQSNGKRASLPKFQATVEDEMPTPTSRSTAVQPQPASRVGKRKKMRIPSHRTSTQSAQGLEQRSQHESYTMRHAQNQHRVRASKEINLNRQKAPLYRQDRPRRISIPSRKIPKEQVVRTFNDTEMSEVEAFDDEASDEEIKAETMDEESASGEDAGEKFAYTEDASTKGTFRGNPVSGSASKEAPLEEGESKESAEDTPQEDTFEIVLEEPRNALNSPVIVGSIHQGLADEVPETDSTTTLKSRPASPTRRHSDGSLTSTGASFYDSDPINLKESFATRNSSSHYRIPDFPKSSRNSSHFASRALAPDTGPPEPSDFVSGADALRLEGRLYRAIYNAILDAFQKHATRLLPFAKPPVAGNEMQRLRHQHPFDTAYPDPKQEASIDSLMSMQNNNRRHETFYGGRKPARSMPSQTNDDRGHPNAIEGLDVPFDLQIPSQRHDRGSQTQQRFRAPHSSILNPSQRRDFLTTQQTDAAPAAIDVAGVRASGRPQQNRGASVARPGGDDVDDELAANPWLLDIESAENTFSDSDSEQSFHTAPASGSRRGSVDNWGDNDPRRMNAIMDSDVNREFFFISQHGSRSGGMRPSPEGSQTEEILSDPEWRPAWVPTPPERVSTQEDDDYFEHPPDRGVPSRSPFLMVPVADRCFVVPLSNFASIPTIPSHDQDHETRESHIHQPRSRGRDRGQTSLRTTPHLAKVHTHRLKRYVYRDDDSQTVSDESESGDDYWSTEEPLHVANNLRRSKETRR